MKTRLTSMLGLWLSACALLMGCGGSDNQSAAPTQVPSEETFEESETEAPVDERGDVPLEPVVVREGRAARRLSVDHLRRSIPMLFGGITWSVEARNGREVVLFDGFSRTLGEADYIQVTETNNEPSPLFAKFMDDMAGQVCAKAIERDQDTPQAQDRLVVRHPDDVDANLRFLRLKLHGIYVPEDSTEGLIDLRQLHGEILNDTDDQRQAWLGVCVAMVTAPEFMAY